MRQDWYILALRCLILSQCNMQKLILVGFRGRYAIMLI